MSRPKGRPLPEEHRAAIARAMHGVPKTLEHRRRMSEGAKESWDQRQAPEGFGLLDDIDGDLEEIEAIAEAIEQRKRKAKAQ